MEPSHPFPIHSFLQHNPSFPHQSHGPSISLHQDQQFNTPPGGPPFPPFPPPFPDPAVPFPPPGGGNGENCWYNCNEMDGPCDWCGNVGLCCRKEWIGNGCDGSIGGTNIHECVLSPGKNILSYK